jgi:type II secretory pathway pseudopilin PulG
MNRTRRTQRGMSLIAMLVIVVIVGGIASAFMLLTITQSKWTDLERNKNRATYVAEAAVEQAAGILRSGFAQQLLVPYNPVTGALVVDGQTVTYAFTDRSPADRRAWLWNITGNVTVNGSNIPFVAQKYMYFPPAPISGALTTSRNLFQITVQTTVNGTLGYVVRDVELDSTPLFQFLAFYNGDLEFLPGPDFKGHGRMHTNGDLYLGAGSTINLLGDHIHAVGQAYRHRKDNGSYTANGGAVTIWNAAGTQSASWDAPAGGNLTDMESMVAGSVNTNWPTNSATLQSVGVKTGATGAQKFQTPDYGAISPPPPGSNDPAKGGYFYQQAASAPVGQGLVIMDGQVVTNGAVDSAATSSLVAQGVIQTTTVADTRESHTTPVTVTKIDMGLLKQSGYYPSNGILYAYQSANMNADGTAKPGNGTNAPPQGVMLMNGSDLSSPRSGTGEGNLSIISNGPVYIQGDFNAPHVMDANGAVMMDPNGSPIQDLSRKQAVAVIADAVNFLSNAWDPNNPSYKPTDGSVLPVASPTNYNFAMVTGNVPTPKQGTATAPEAYSGGLENLPRFQENWQNTAGRIAANYKGAMVNLEASKVAVQPWGQGGVYNPPARNWDFDQDFTDPSKPPPPAFPTGVNIARTTYGEAYQTTGPQ